MSKTETASEPPEPLQPPYEQPEPYVLRSLWDRLHRQNKHAMVALVGEEGSGKSLTACRMASEIDPAFGADRVLFDVGELLQILHDGDHEPGQAYVLDEAGVSLGRRTWQERSQILANQALQLIRSHNLALFFTIPRLGELDSQAQGRLQAFFEIRSKNEGQYVIGSWYNMDPDRRDETGTIYTEKPRIEQPDGPNIRVDFLKIAPPPNELAGEYLEQKRAHQKDVYERTLKEMGDREDTDEEAEAERSVQEIAESIDNAEQYVSEHPVNKTEYVDKDLLKLEFDLTDRDARTLQKLLRRRLGL